MDHRRCANDAHCWLAKLTRLGQSIYTLHEEAKMKIPLFQDAPDFLKEETPQELQRYTFKMEELEGVDIESIRPVDLTTDAVTPITHQPIPQVNKFAWKDMSATDLQDQYATMENRYFTMLGMGRPDVAAQIQRGLEEIRKIIRLKSKEEAEFDPRKKLSGDNDGTT